MNKLIKNTLGVLMIGGCLGIFGWLIYDSVTTPLPTKADYDAALEDK